MPVTAPAPRAALAMAALRLPEADASMWPLVARMRRGEPMSLAEYLLIVEGLAFPTAPGVLRVLAEALRDAGGPHLLVGGFAVGALTANPRSTVDIDVIINADRLPPLLDALEARLGPLDVTRYRGLARVAQPAVDVILASTNRLRSRALRPELSREADLGDGLILRLPVPELAIILKYAAALSLSRSAEDTAQDIADLGRLVARHPDLDLERLSAIGRVLRTRSPKEILEIVATLRAGGGVVVTKRGSRASVVCVPG